MNIQEYLHILCVHMDTIYGYCISVYKYDIDIIYIYIYIYIWNITVSPIPLSAGLGHSTWSGKRECQGETLGSMKKMYALTHTIPHSVSEPPYHTVFVNNRIPIHLYDSRDLPFWFWNI